MIRRIAFDKLIARKLSGEITPVEEKRLNAWLNASPSNRDRYDKIVLFSQEVRSMPIPGCPDPKDEWSQLQEVMGTRARQKGGERKSHRRTASRRPAFSSAGTGLRYAPILAFLVILCAGVLIWKTYLSKTGLRKTRTPFAQQTELLLPDGTQVRLNSGSTLRYPKNFAADRRKVRLSGEAFFDVKEKDEPFVVVTGNAKVTVLGTLFNVWARDKKTRVIVKQGCVRFESIDSEANAVHLVKNNISVIAGKQPPSAPRSVDADRRIGWPARRLVFEQTPLIEIIEELERAYDVRIVSRNSDVQGKTLTGSFDGMAFDEVLSSICLALNLEFESKGGRTVLFGRGGPYK